MGHQPSPDNSKRRSPRKIVTLIFSITGIICLLVVGFLSYQWYKLYKDVSPYLSSERFILPKMEYSNDDITSMKQKYTLITSSAAQHRQTISLNSPEINLILRDRLDMAKTVRVELKDNKIHFLYTVPFPFSGKYFNGSGVIAASLDDGKIHCTIEDLVSNNKQLSDSVKKGLEIAFVKILTGTTVKDQLHKISRLYVNGDQLYIEFKP